MFGSLLSINYCIDPLQYIRKASYKPLYITQERHQLPGLARTQNYDTVIIGSSHTQNFKPSSIKEILGFSTLKLSIAGSTLYEQILVLNIALNRKILKNMIWGLEPHNMLKEHISVRDDLGPFPYHLYKDLLFVLPKYLVNLETVKLSINIILKNFLKKNIKTINYTEDLNLYNNWNMQYQDSKKHDKVKEINDKINIENVISFNPEKATQYLTSQEMVYVKENLNAITEIIKAHPEINFFIFFPPYSITHYRLAHAGKKLEAFLANQILIMNSLLKYKNVYLYDFFSEENIIMNTKNYKDVTHYWEEINDYMLRSIKENKHRITNEQDAIKSIHEICRLVNKTIHLN